MLRWTVIGVMAAGVMVVGACSSHSDSSLAAPSPPTVPTTASTAPPTTAAVVAGTTTTLGSCAQIAATRIYIQLTAARTEAGAVVATGYPATLVCGGPDDFHFSEGTSTTTVHLVSDATVTVLTFPGPTNKTIAPTDLPSYLVSDQGTKVFQVTGPASAVTSLVEQYHP